METIKAATGRYAAFIVAIFVVCATVAHAQERPECLVETARVEELSGAVGLNDFDGTDQAIIVGAYTRSTCIGGSVNRFRLEVSSAGVDEFNSDAQVGLVGVGFELRPFISNPDIIVTPVARFGVEHLSGRGERSILGGAVSAQALLFQRNGKRSLNGKEIVIPRHQFILGGVAEYTDRRVIGSGPASGLFLPSSANASFAGFAVFDHVAGTNSRVRWTGGYQTTGDGSVDGFAFLELGFRPVDTAHQSYRWNFAVRGNIGDNGYRGVIFSLTRRFVTERPKQK